MFIVSGIFACRNCVIKSRTSSNLHYVNLSLFRDVPRFSCISRGFRLRRQNVPHKNHAIKINQFSRRKADVRQKSPRILKPFLFTIAFTGCTFAGVSIWQYENARRRFFSKSSYYELKMNKQSLLRQKINNWWNNLTQGQKVFWPLCFLNVLVFLAWKNPSWRATMLLYFTSNPAAKSVCWPMFLHTFSHYNFFHLAINMIVLQSFMPITVAELGKEEFLGLYFSGGVIASFVSILYKTVTRKMVPSLGASCSIYAIVMYFCSQHPELKLHIIFLPWFTFSAGIGMWAILGFETAGVVLGWKYFDHVGHLTGAVLGIMYSIWGKEYFSYQRNHLINWWQKIREQRRD